MILNCWLTVPNAKYTWGLKIITLDRVNSQREGGEYPNTHQFTSYNLRFPSTILYSHTQQSTDCHHVYAGLCEENKGNVQLCEEIY